MCMAAMAERTRLLNLGRDPLNGVFLCTTAEKAAILDKPPFMVRELSTERERICGLKVTVVDGPQSQGKTDEQRK